MQSSLVKDIQKKTSDYDFKSMIGSAGNYGQEIMKARLFAGLLYSFGTAIAEGIPVKNQVRVEGKCINSIVPELQTKRGSLVEVSNLGDEADEVIFHADRISVPIELEPLETRLIPMNVRVICSDIEDSCKMLSEC